MASERRRLCRIDLSPLEEKKEITFICDLFTNWLTLLAESSVWNEKGICEASGRLRGSLQRV